MILTVTAGTLLIRFLSPAYFEHVEILLTRVPVFLLGAFCGNLCQRHVKVPRILPLLCIPAAAAGLMLIPLIPVIWLRRWTYALWTAAIVTGHAYLCSLFRRMGFLYGAVCLTGVFSLEMYLIYEKLYVAEPRLFVQADAVGVTYAAAVFAASLILSALLKAVLDLLRKEYHCMNSDKGKDVS